MRWARRPAFLVILALGMTLIAPLASGDDVVPPEIAWFTWTPRYPIHPQDVLLSARISDSSGILYATATWCFLNSTICNFYDMTDGDADGIWTATASTRVPLPEDPEEKEGVAIQVFAGDTEGNEQVIGKFYAAFVEALDITFSNAVFEAEPGTDVQVSGTVVYDQNTSAPAEATILSVEVGTETHQSVVDAAGAFSVTLSAPTDVGTYAIAASVSDRSITGIGEATLVVSTTPLPELVVSSLTSLTSDAIEGRPVSAALRVSNIGTVAAADAHVTADIVAGDGAEERILDQVVDLDPLGGALDFDVSWTARRGSQTLRVAIDPENAIDEVDELNNVKEHEVTARVWDPTGSDATGDADGDGFSNRQEFEAGSDAWDAASVPKPSWIAANWWLVVLLVAIPLIGLSVLALRQRRLEQVDERAK